MLLPPLLVGATIITLVLFSGIGFIIWLFPSSEAESPHKKRS